MYQWTIHQLVVGMFATKTQEVSHNLSSSPMRELLR